MGNATHFADAFMALWNEPDPDRRRQHVASLWTEDGVQILQPPQEMKEIASRPGIGLATWLQARGHAELLARAATVYGEFVAPGEFHFRRRDDVEHLADVVKLRWEMVSREGNVMAVGLDFLVLAPDGRILRDYVFVEA